jgi:hypothetical protein
VRALPYQAVGDLPQVGLSRDQARRAAWWIPASPTLVAAAGPGPQGGRAAGERRRGSRRPGGPRAGHRAIGWALRACRFPWPLVGALLLVPPLSWLAALGYALVVRLRHRLPGSVPACDGAWDLEAGAPAPRRRGGDEGVASGNEE